MLKKDRVVLYFCMAMVLKAWDGCIAIGWNGLGLVCIAVVSRKRLLQTAARESIELVLKMHGRTRNKIF